MRFLSLVGRKTVAYKVQLAMFAFTQWNPLSSVFQLTALPKKK